MAPEVGRAATATSTFNGNLCCLFSLAQVLWTRRAIAFGLGRALLFCFDKLLWISGNAIVCQIFSAIGQRTNAWDTRVGNDFSRTMRIIVFEHSRVCSPLGPIFGNDFLVTHANSYYYKMRPSEPGQLT